MDTISVIIPVYNTGKYIERCIDSLLSQTLMPFEIILVNDGSYDHSGVICRNYADRYRFIKYIYIEHRGVSSARNIGLDAALGHYIVFMDSDDYVLDDYLMILYNNIKNTDLSVCGYYKTNTMPSEQNVYGNESIYINAEEYMVWLFNHYNYDYQGTVWNKMFCAEIIKKHNIRFDEKLFYNEDRLFNVEYLSYCSKVSFTENRLYVYRQNEAGAISMAEQKCSYESITELTAYHYMIKFLHERNYKAYSECLSHAFYAALELRKKSSRITKSMVNDFIKEFTRLIITDKGIGISEKIKKILKMIFIQIVYK